MDNLQLELTDLSLRDFITLQIIQRLGKTTRHQIMLELEQYFDGQKKISPSSFYHSLDKFHNLGLVKYEKEGKRTKTVGPADNLKEVLDQFTASLISSSFSMIELEVDFIPEIEKRIDSPSLGRVLVVETSNYIDFYLMTYLKQRSEQLHVMSLTGYNLEELPWERTNLRDNIIREPDKYFDTIIIPVYLSQFPQVSKKLLFMELMRVLSSSGVIIATAIATFPTTGNYFADVVLDQYQKVLSDRLIEEEVMKEEFVRFFSEPEVEVSNHRGICIGIVKRN